VWSSESGKPGASSARLAIVAETLAK